MAAAGPVTSMRVDGSLSADPTLLRLQADALGMDLLVGRADTTVLGAAMLAGVGAGVFDSVDDAALRLEQPAVVRHRGDQLERTRARDRWRAFVAAGSRL
jgi:glycerol kinase